MGKGRSRRSAKVAAIKGNNKETENVPVPKEKKRRCPPRVDLTSIAWSDKVTHPAVWTVLTLMFAGLLIYLTVLMCSIDWTAAHRVEEPVTTTVATISTAAATSSEAEERSTVAGGTKALGSTISLSEREGAANHLAAKQASCETCSSQLSQSAMSSFSMSSTCGGNNRCSVNSQCIEGVETYTCTCDVGYYGIYCDVALSDCGRLLCDSHGECRKRVDTKQIYCSCTGGYTGDNCEVQPVVTSSPCSNLTTPCSGNAQCIDLSEENYTCVCHDGFNGTDCAVDINECEISPCYHGNCTDLVNGFSCDCELGYDGLQCQTDTEDCSTNSCPTHSTCIDMVDNYTCLCDMGYTGVDCHSLCDDEPCFNNSTCSLCEGGSCNGTGLPFRCNCTNIGNYGVLCTDRDGYWSDWSEWEHTREWSILVLETYIFSSPMTNCTYINTTRTRTCIEHIAAGAPCQGSGFEEAALDSDDVECECLLCCEGNLSCEEYIFTGCECNEGCGGLSLSHCCNNRDFVCANTPVITASDLI